MFGKGDIDMANFNKREQLKIEIVRSLYKKQTKKLNNDNNKKQITLRQEAQALFDWIWED